LGHFAFACAGYRHTYRTAPLLYPSTHLVDRRRPRNIAPDGVCWSGVQDQAEARICNI